MSFIAARRYVETGPGSARRMIGVSGALSVHLLLLLSWFAQTDGPATLARRPMPFGAEHGSPEGFRTIAVLLDGPAEQERSQPEGALSNPIILKTMTLDRSLLDSPNSASPFEQSSAEQAALGDPAQAEQFARLRGIYFSQVHARVRRVWEKPAAGLATQPVSVECLALVLQDARGAVLEVELAGCPDDVPLQQSIVRAIHRASPLPAPPDPSVFTQRLRIAFDLTDD